MINKCDFNMVLIQMVTVLFVINFVTAGILDQVTDRTMVESDSQAINKEDSSKQEMANILSIGQFFQDIFSEHLTPHKIEFGHVCENPSEWEQRFERKDFDSNRHSGKIKWGNKRGDYGEQYWDFNH